jgi:large subunit ribosomal protein L21
MYAIIRAGGKQAKVRSGDVIEVERVKNAADTVEFQPMLVVDDEGNTHAAGDALTGATVTAKVLGEVKGDKIDIFKYKNKSGYRRRMGHRQTFTQLEITGITLPSDKPAKKSTAKTATAKSSTAKSSTAKTATAKKATAKKSTAKKSTAKTAQAEKSQGAPAEAASEEE